MNKGWKEIFFFNFIKLNRGFDLPNNKIEAGNYPVIASTSIKAYHKNFKVIAPCVTTGRSGSLGVVQYVNQDSWPLNTTLYVKDFKKNDPKFVYYFLQTMDFDTFNSGAGVPTLNQNHLHHIKIQIPKDITHQKRIASILSAYDDLIEVNNKRIELLEQSARELYKEWFVRMRFPNYQNTKFNKGIPEGWKEVYLKEIADFTYGKMPQKELIKRHGYPIFSGYNTVGFYPFYMFPNPTLVIVARGVGGTGDIKITPQKCWLTNLSIAILLKNYSHLYYFYYLLSNDNLRILDSGAAQSQITIDSLSKYKILHANNEIIDSFNNKILSLLYQIENLQKQNQELTAIRDRLLPRLMSGKLEVKA